ncbi:unnamed protein product [Adineta steineri]|uniref:Uncharacterized protein n=1 Tax=Adineta steineri TaxID=433720 RepID=A0A819P5H1_9BILA|nr:unnamed protein product [Adineta steineri]
MARQPKYKLEQPRNSSDNPFDVTNLTTIPRNHHSHGNNHEQTNADSNFRYIHIDLIAARKNGQSYEIPQQQPSIIPNINRPHINEDSTNEMILQDFPIGSSNSKVFIT